MSRSAARLRLAGKETSPLRPARVYLITTIALTAVSLLAPLSAADTATSTKLTLAVGHILAAAVIIPPVTRRLTRR